MQPQLKSLALIGILGVLGSTSTEAAPPIRAAAVAAVPTASNTAPSTSLEKKSTAVSKAPESTHDWQIEPGKRVGPITRTTTETELKKHFGAKNLRGTQYDEGEGRPVPATIVYPNDPAKKLIVVWEDAKTRSGVRAVVIRGEKSEWKTRSGVTVGTLATDLEKLNGRAFTFFGFDWAFAGTVTSWKDGSLEPELKQVTLRLSPSAKFHPRAMAALIGDQELKSTHPNLKGVDPFVNELVVGFDAQPAELPSMNIATAPAP